MERRPKMQQVFSYIHTDKADELRELCQEKGRSISETVRFAIYHLLAEHKPE